MTRRIRWAEAADLEPLLLLFEQQDLEDSRYSGTPPTELPLLRERLDAALFGPMRIGRALIAEAEGAVRGVAFLGFLFPGDRGRPGWFLKNLFVAPEARGVGHGTALIEACLAEARAAGADRLEFHVHPANEGAQRLYRRLDFEQRGDRLVFRMDL